MTLENNSKRHLVIFHCVSSGLNGPDLGSDENEIVFMVYLIIDLQTKQVSVWLLYYWRLPNILSFLFLVQLYFTKSYYDI